MSLQLRLLVLFIHYIQIQFALFLVLHLICTAGKNELRGCLLLYGYLLIFKLGGVKFKDVDNFSIHTLGIPIVHTLVGCDYNKHACGAILAYECSYWERLNDQISRSYDNYDIHRYVRRICTQATKFVNSDSLFFTMIEGNHTAKRKVWWSCRNG